MSPECPSKIDSFNSCHEKIGKCHSKKGLLICSLNAPSLLRHKDEISILIKENKVDVIASNKTKLDKKIADDAIAIDDFILKHLDKNRHGGGVAIYIRETLNFEHRVDFPTGNLEAICIEVKPKCGKPFFIVAWYRPPKYESETLVEMETLLKALENEKKEIILIGDLNCNDLPADDKNMMIKQLRDLYRIYQLKQRIKEPTRSTLTSATMIDHFATNKHKLIIDSDVIATGFSNHDIIYGICKVFSWLNRSPKITKHANLSVMTHRNFERIFGKLTGKVSQNKMT